MILSARLPINCINLRTSKLEKLENNLIKLFFGFRNGEFAYSIVFKIIDNDPQHTNLQNTKHVNNNFKKEKNKKKNESYSTSSDDEEHSNDGQSSSEYKDTHKSYLSSTDDEHESIGEENMITLTFNDEGHSSAESINFVTWEDALSGKIDITADGELINSSKNELNKPNINNLLASNPLPNNGKTTTNANLLTVRTDEHRRRLSLQTIPETDNDI